MVQGRVLFLNQGHILKVNVKNCVLENLLLLSLLIAVLEGFDETCYTEMILNAQAMPQSCHAYMAFS